MITLDFKIYDLFIEHVKNQYVLAYKFCIEFLNKLSFIKKYIPYSGISMKLNRIQFHQSDHDSEQLCLDSILVNIARLNIKNDKGILWCINFSSKRIISSFFSYSLFSSASLFFVTSRNDFHTYFNGNILSSYLINSDSIMKE